MTTYQIGDQVLLSTKNLKLKKGSKKLLPRYVGPFSISKAINPVAYKLDLPKTWRVHPVFHVSLLRKYHENAEFIRAPPLPSVIEGELDYTVESILAHERTKAGLWFLVHWKGFPLREATWEPETHLQHCSKVLKKYKLENQL